MMTARQSTLNQVATNVRHERHSPVRQYSARSGTWMVLRDSSELLIRPVQAEDAALLTDGFARLSAESRHFRFLTTKTHLSRAEVRYFTEVDHHDHEALGALSRVDGRGVGIARYIRDIEDPQAADVAVAVVDDWQRRGVGPALLDLLVDRALDEGVRRFTALVDDGNGAVIRLLRKMNADVELVSCDFGTLEFHIALRPLMANASASRGTWASQ